MKNFLSFPAIIIAGFAIVAQVQAQQIPADPPTQWSVYIRFYGTTSQPGHDDLQIFVHTNGKLPASIDARRPVYDEQGNILLKSPEHKQILKDEARAEIYSTVRSLVHSHRIGEVPEPQVRDGDSVEITVASFERKISVVFDHSSAANSDEFRTLVKVLHSTLPSEFLPRVDDGTEKLEVIRNK